MEFIASKFNFRFFDPSLQPSYSHRVLVTCAAQGEIEQMRGYRIKNPAEAGFVRRGGRC
jgi:hypothetical protein